MLLAFGVKRRLLFQKEWKECLELLHCKKYSTSESVSEDNEHISTMMKLCSDRHYLVHDYLGKEHLQPGSHCVYGPFGMELRKNVLDQWWRSVVTCRPQVFGISTLHGLGRSSAVQERTLRLVDSEALSKVLHQRIQNEGNPGEMLQGLLQDCVPVRTSLLQGALEQYVTFLKLMNKKLAFGLAETGVSYPPYEGQAGEVVWPPEVMQASLVWFCSPRTSSQWLDYWTRHRLQWWRKFALGPSHFSCSDVTVGKDAERVTNGVKVMYQFPWGAEPIETLWNLGDSELLQAYTGSRAKLQGRDGRKSVVPHVISVSGNIDRGVLAYLHNSLQTVRRMDSKQRQYTRKVLKLHPSLTPVKLVLDMGKGPTTDLRQVCEALLQEFLDAGIASWPGYRETVLSSVEQLNIKYDEMGVLFTVVISDVTLESGLVQLRSRDTTIKETMHISEVKSFVSRYITAAENV